MTGLLAWPPAPPAAISIAPVPPPNLFAPDADNDTATTGKGKPVTINVLANDVPTLGLIDPATVTIVSSTPANGSHVVNFDGTVTYSPALNFTGTDSFTYTVANNFGSVSHAATVTVTVVAPPQANPDSTSTTIGSQISIDVLANDTAGNGTINPSSVNVVSPPTSGCGSVFNPGNGTLLYTAPAAVPASGVCTFGYRVTDSFTPPQSSNVATVTVTITAGNLPVAVNDRVFTPVGATITIDVLANDISTVPINPATVLITPPGAASANPTTGLITYTAPGAPGTYAFTYTVRDTNGGLSNIASVTANVTSVVAVNDAQTMTAAAGAKAVINVIGNDTSSIAINPASVVIVSQPANGSAVANAGGTVTYTPNPGYVSPSNTPDTFTYTVKDILGVVSNAATVAVTVEAPNEVLTVTRAEFQVGGAAWRIDGTTTARAAGETMTIYNGPTVGATPLGTVTVTNNGTWTLSTNGPQPVLLQKISVKSFLGSVLEGVTLVVR
jgi:hypothetical protein